MANERMINSVSVGIVYVASPGDFAISDAEKAHILAEVQEGLDAVAANEPRANLSWVYSTLSANLPSFTPWEGANWPGLTEPFYRSMDGALWSDTNQKIYFFRGNQYIRVDPNNGWKADPSYPKPIAGNWPGFPANFTSNISDALWSGTNQKIYFFKGSEYIRVDPNNGWNVDPDYPKPIAGNWPGFPADFANGVDTAEWAEFNQRIYFFKGTRYIRVNPANSWNVDGGYPRNININWRMAFPTA
jgi:Hemopexin